MSKGICQQVKDFLINQKLSNKSFLSNAPKNIVEKFNNEAKDLKVKILTEENWNKIIN